MLTIGQKIPDFNLVAVKPGFNSHEENGESAFEAISEASFAGKWKVRRRRTRRRFMFNIN
jgi:lipoyl-dependent peroxiredoxin subunit C